MPALEVSGSYVGVESLKRAANFQGGDRDAVLLDHLLAASRDIELLTFRCFFPFVSTDYYRWPPLFNAPYASWSLWLEQDLISVSALNVAASGTDAVPVPLTHYFLEPQQYGPPYNRIEVDLSSGDVFQSGSTPQRSVSVLGQWGYNNKTVAAGTLAAAISSTSAATATCSDTSRIDQGDVLLIDSEAIYVDNPRIQVDTTATLSDNSVTASASVVTVPVSSGVLVNVNEVILIDSEQMLVTAITSNNLVVMRAFNGTPLAAHVSGAHVYAPRGLTIQRGVNGTTAATHLISAPIAKYQAPADIRRVVRADAIGSFQQDLSSWGRTVGAGDMAVEFQGKALKSFRQTVIDEFCRVRTAAI